MLNVQVQTPAHGAAYRVLYERFNPTGCATRERANEIKAGFDSVLIWAATQAPIILAAYSWASQEILLNIENRLAQQELARQCEQAYASLPQPPANEP